MGPGQRSRSTGDVLQGYPSGPGATVAATEAARRRTVGARAVVLVEGVSDQIALETLARRLGRDLAADGIVVLPIGGAHAIRRELDRLVGDVAGAGRTVLAGLCDEAEVPEYRRGLERAGVGPTASDADLEDMGFFACVRDLEEELIRAAGRATVEGVLRDQGDLPAFRTLQRQPAWRERSFDAQAHRWLRAGARRNLRYARLLVEAVEPDRMPRPLTAVLLAAGTEPATPVGDRGR